MRRTTGQPFDGTEGYLFPSETARNVFLTPPAATTTTTATRLRGLEKGGNERGGHRTVLTISETPVGATWDGGYNTLEDAVGAYILIET